MFYWRILCIVAVFFTLIGCDIPNGEIKGKVTYEKVPHSDVSHGLEYDKSFNAPIRGVRVELIEDGNVIDSVITNEQGEYKFIKKLDSFVSLRVRAELNNGSDDDDNNQWQVKVVDNTNDNALYTMGVDTFEVKREEMNIDIHASAGSWSKDGGYANTRTAAPFHILDKVYDILVKLDGITDVDLPALTFNWSPNNIPEFGDIPTGKIGTSYYQNGQIFLLGAENIDTDEYDQHVIIHEWGHFLEDTVARSDSVGGPHAGGDRLDMRVAFGEGFGNAWSAIITDKPIYQDSFDTDQSSGFAINMEDNDVINPGWFSEGSVQSLLYDIYDEASDGQDFISLGLEPIYQILVGPQKNTEALTSIFSFMTYLKADNPEFINDFNNLLELQQINPNLDIWGTNEDNDAALPEALPVYLELNVGETIRVCTSTSYGDAANKLANHRFIKLNASAAGSYQITLTPSRNNDVDGYIFTKGELIASNEDGGIAPVSFTVDLSQGVSILDAIAYNEEGTSVAATCFDAEFLLN